MDIEKRRLSAIAKRNLGWKVKRICSSEQISKKTFYRWWNRYQQQGKQGLVKLSTRPKTIHYQISDRTKQRIIAIREEHGYCAETIEQILNKES